MLENETKSRKNMISETTNFNFSSRLNKPRNFFNFFVLEILRIEMKLRKPENISESLEIFRNENDQHKFQLMQLIESVFKIFQVR